MRVTENLRYSQINSRLASLRSQYDQASTEATTGQRINAPSDDPVASSEAIRTSSEVTQNEAYQRSIDLVKGDVEMAEAALAETGTIIQRALELAMQGANGSNSADQRQALAIEATQLVSQIIELANTKGSQGFLFAGTKTDTAAFSTTGVFQGNDDAHVIQTGTGTNTTVNTSGALAFTSAGGRNVIEDLQALALALQTDDTATIAGSLDALQVGHDQVSRERSRAGLTINRLDLSSTILADKSVSLAARQSTAIGADPVKSYSRLTQLEAAISDSVTVSKRILALSNLERF